LPLIVVTLALVPTTGGYEKDERCLPHVEWQTPFS